MAMAVYSEAKRGDPLTMKLRDYSVRNVKISEEGMACTRGLVHDYVDNKVMSYCKENSALRITRLEYTGSAYERLKTEAADEVDVMVVLRTRQQEVTVQEQVEKQEEQGFNKDKIELSLGIGAGIGAVIGGLLGLGLEARKTKPQKAKVQQAEEDQDKVNQVLRMGAALGVGAGVGAGLGAGIGAGIGLASELGSTKLSSSLPDGYVKLKARETSPLRKYADSEGYIDPERLRNGWFYSLVCQAVNFYSSSFSPLEMQVRAHGPAVQLDIYENFGKRLLSADLVPCFCIEGNYYVAKPYTGTRPVNIPGLLWRQSFSLKEKEMLQYMDRDHGCRHELLRIMKTIVKREAPSLGKLTSYHLKTVFLQYNEKYHDWTGTNSLGKNFLGFIRELQDCLESGTIEHYWLPDVDLLEDINPGVVRKMADRLKRILNSEKERNKILDN